ncbi:MAG: phospholipid carrier-dependent glycosyltransferase [Nitrosomonas ureae]
MKSISGILPMSIVFSSTITIVLPTMILAIAFWMRKTTPSENLKNKWESNCLWFLSTLKVSILLLAAWSGYTTLWADDGYRLSMSRAIVEGSKNMFSQLVWPSGSLLLNALVMNLSPDPVMGVRFTTVALSLGTIFVVGWVTRLINGNSIAVLTAALLVSVLPMHNWLSTSFMSEIPMIFFVMLSVGLALKSWILISEASGLPYQNKHLWQPASHRVMGWLLAILAGFSATMAASCRYEAWMFILAFGFTILMHYFWRQSVDFLPQGIQPKSKPVNNHFSIIFTAGTVALLFPLAWIAASWQKMGHPLAFFSDIVSETKLLSGGTIFDAGFIYLQEIFLEIGVLSSIGLVAVAVSVMLARSRPRIFFYAVLVTFYYGVTIIIIGKNGTGLSIQRYIHSLIVLLFPLVGFAVGLVEEARVKMLKNPMRIIAYATLIFCYTSLIAFAFHSIGVTSRYRWYGFQNASFVAGYLLTQELHHPQALPGVYSGGKILIWTSGVDFAMLKHIPIMTGLDNQYLWDKSIAFPEKFNNDKVLTVLQAGSFINKPPADYVLIFDLMDILIYRRKDQAN